MSHLRYEPEIDGLRAVAVLAVVAFHAGFGPPGGFAGVDVFFVISGYLMTRLLETEWHASGRVAVWAFFARRVRRLLPMLLTVVVAASIGACFLLPPYGERGAALQSAASALVLAANVFFQTHSGGYFDPRSDQMPLLHLWSLSVEEQFYLLWPMLFVFSRRWGNGAWRTAVVMLAAASFVTAEMLIARGSPAAFFSLPARWWELAAGAAVAWLPRQTWIKAPLVAWAGIVGIAVAIAFPMAHFPGLGSVPSVLGTALILWAVPIGADIGLPGKLLRMRALVFTGRLSYSLYLWHWPLLALAAASHPGPLPLPMRMALVLAAFMLSVASTRWVETPFRRPDGAIVPARLVAATTLCSIALAAVLFNLSGVATEQRPPDDLASRTTRDYPMNRGDCHYRGDEAIDPFPREGCSSEPSLPVRVAIWGDSHALAWQPFAWAWAHRDGVAAEGFTRDACAPALGFDNGKRPLEAERCRDFNARVLDRLKGMDTVIVTAWWPNPGRADFGQRFAETLRKLAPTVGHVILLGQTPNLPEAAPTCIRMNDLKACNVARGEFDRTSAEVREMLAHLASQYANVSYVDPEDYFCDAATCPAVRNGIGLYWDTNHVASTAARRFAETYLATHLHEPQGRLDGGPTRPLALRP